MPYHRLQRGATKMFNYIVWHKSAMQRQHTNLSRHRHNDADSSKTVRNKIKNFNSKIVYKLISDFLFRFPFMGQGLCQLHFNTSLYKRPDGF
jgi:hypothetical protein